MERREFLTKAAAAGAIAWAAPVILSRPAYAQGTGSPACQPTITVTCDDFDCPPAGGLLGPIFPGVSITIGNCNCDPGTPPPVSCVNFVDVPTGVEVYETPGTSCLSALLGNDTLTEGDWECVGQTQQVFFGPPRLVGVGPIPAFLDRTFTVTLVVFAGCADATNCHTFDIEITSWNRFGGTCAVGDATPDLCASITSSPCGTC